MTTTKTAMTMTSMTTRSAPKTGMAPWPDNGMTQQGAPADEVARSARFQALYESLKDRMRRTIYSISGAQDIDDIVQDAFVRIWKGLDSFRGESDPKTWAYRIAVNSAREHWRKQGRRRAATLRYLEEPRASSVAPPQEAWSLSRAVVSALAGLSDAQREVVTLVYLEGLSLSEAASALDIPEGTVKSRLHTARQALAAILEKEGDKP